MHRIRYGFIVMGMLLCLATSATAGVSIGIGIGLPTVSIGINLPLYPELVPVPGYPVYYAPRVDGNYFFYDGMYWVYQDDNWYASSWYNGPWGFVEPSVVPLFILRVPVSYYRQPPVYFRGWRSDAPPRWGQHWGHSWEQRRSGWDRWNRSSAPRPAPLPVYQRQYTGDRYPRVEQQRVLRSEQYRYQPREKAVREHFKQVEQKAPAPAQRQEKPQVRSPQRQEIQHSAPQQQGAPAVQRQQAPQRGGERDKRPAPVQAAPQNLAPAHDQKQPAAVQREQKPRPQPAAVQREQKQKPQPAAVQREQKPRPQPAAVQREQKQRPQPAAVQQQRAPQKPAQQPQRDREQKSKDKDAPQDRGGNGGSQDRGHGQGQNKDEGRGR